MKHIKNQLDLQKFQAEKVPERMNCSPGLKTCYKQENEEDKMIRLKYASPQIFSMSDQEIKNWSMALLLKIHVITGWVIPSSNLLNILLDQFEKKLMEDYSMLNTEEIEYAFRKNGTIIKDWGKEMNLNLVDQVLSPYLADRLQASSNEERKKSVVIQQKIYSDNEILNQRRWQIEQAFQAMKKGYYPILHSYFQEVLITDGLLKEDETIADFFVRKLNSNSGNIYVAD